MQDEKVRKKEQNLNEQEETYNRKLSMTNWMIRRKRKDIGRKISKKA